MNDKRGPQRPTALPVKESKAQFLESLSDARVALLSLARRAKEEKHLPTAKALTDQGHALRDEIARLRKAAVDNWSNETRLLLPRIQSAQTRLTRLIEQGEKSAKRTALFTRALGVVSTLLALSRKAL